MLSLLLALAAGPSIGPEGAPDGCVSAPMEQVSFISGHWAATEPDSILAHGEVLYAEVFGGCGLTETQSAVFESQWPLGEGSGLLRFDPLDHVWRYTFIGDGVALEAEGPPGAEPGRLELAGSIQFLTGGSQRPARIGWRMTGADSIEHRIWMLDTDNGQFTPWQTIILRPVATTPRPRTPAHWIDEG